MTVTIYHNPRCSKSRQTLALLQERGISPQIIEYLKTPPSVAELQALLAKLGFSSARQLMRTKEDIQLLAIVANTMLFVAMAEIINLDLLWQYKTEILVMFVATTIIRAAMMAKFAIITNRTDKMTNVNFRWWGVLTFAGIKGGLSVVMLMMIPASFEHLEMFKAIVIGVIMLSTFIYSFILIAIIGKNKDIFARELEEEGGHH